MKTHLMKKWLLLLFIGLSGRVFSQQKFIEVRVTDTVLARAEIFVYRIVATPSELMSDLAARQDTDYNNYGKRLEDMRRSQKRSFDSLLVSVRRQFDLLPPRLIDTFLVSVHSLEAFAARVLLHSVDSLARLCYMVRAAGHLIGTVEMAVAADEGPYRDALYRKLLDDAARKAGKIAGYNHQRLGTVVSVTEEKQTEPASGWTSYVPLSALGDEGVTGWQTTLQPPQRWVNQTRRIDDLYAIKGALVVRFEVE
jgi:hypothetical protein